MKLEEATIQMTMMFPKQPMKIMKPAMMMRTVERIGCWLRIVMFSSITPWLERLAVVASVGRGGLRD